MNDIRYDDQFNLNEWVIIISLCAGVLVLLWLPRRFPAQTTGVYLMCGVFWGFFFDHTLGVFPVSYYDINDTNRFEVMDFFTHVAYAPYSYVFFHLYDFIRIKSGNTLLYILVWAFVSVGIERVCVAVGIFHYRHGYGIYYSFVIYLMVFSVWVILYHVLRAYGDKRF